MEQDKGIKNNENGADNSTENSVEKPKKKKE